ncbi:hypothetical protein TNCV_572841 [Trichonephila clavipes]|nr:hypothetical protein TNCV_572841 [Trichonephila clavipes]
MGSALETGGWQFIDQHGHMRRLNQVNLSDVTVRKPKAFGCFFPHHVVGSKFIDMLCLHDGPFEIVQPRLFDANGLYKTEQTLVWRWALGRGYPLGLRPCHDGIFNASGLSGSVTGTTVVERCSGKSINRGP